MFEKKLLDKYNDKITRKNITDVYSNAFNTNNLSIIDKIKVIINPIMHLLLIM